MEYCLQCQGSTNGMSDEIDTSMRQFNYPLVYVMGFFYTVAGLLHFIVPKTYERVIPSQFPRPLFLVYVSGIAEIVLGIGVMIQRTRRLSAWGLIALLIAVFPVNIHMATNDMATDVGPDWATDIIRKATWARLPLQGILILWAWWYTRLPPERSD